MKPNPRWLADYLWLIHSNHLIKLCCVEKAIRQSLFDIDKILAHASTNPVFDETQTGNRLGQYFESLAFAAINNHSDFSLHLANAQIFQNNQTLGELDAIIKDNHTNRLIHVEMAVKFYLQLNTGAELRDWIGPGLKDRLDRKYNHLTKKQLTLIHRIGDQDYAELALNPDIQPALLSRGRLYYPYQSFMEASFVFPQEINPDHDKGFWITESLFGRLLDESSLNWYELPKAFWLSEVTEQDTNQLIAADKQSSRPARQVVAMRRGREYMRGFVVTSDWIESVRHITEAG